MSESERKSRWDDAPAPAAVASDPSATAPEGSSAPVDMSEAAAKAAAIAAKIAASIRPPGSTGQEIVKRAEAVGDYVKDIEINDLRNRYVLTKAATQKQIEDETGASIQTKGVWAPDRTRMPPGEQPLFLHIVALSQVILDAAVGKVNELINQELGPLIEDRTLIARSRAMGLPPPPTTHNVRPKWPEDRLFINLEPMRNFNIRAKIVGPGGMFVKYIQAETGARVQIKGRGSGFVEQDTGRESDEQMHVSIAAPTEDQVYRARVLAEDLIAVLHVEYEKARAPQTTGGVYQGYGNYSAAGGQEAYGQTQDPYAGYYAAAGAGADQSAAAAVAAPAAGAPPAQGTDAWAQYAAYWAQYGYDVNDPQFQAWQATQYQQGSAGAAPAAA